MKPRRASAQRAVLLWGHIHKTSTLALDETPWLGTLQWNHVSLFPHWNRFAAIKRPRKKQKKSIFFLYEINARWWGNWLPTVRGAREWFVDHLPSETPLGKNGAWAFSTVFPSASLLHSFPRCLFSTFRLQFFHFCFFACCTISKCVIMQSACGSGLKRTNL